MKDHRIAAYELIKTIRRGLGLFTVDAGSAGFPQQLSRKRFFDTRIDMAKTAVPQNRLSRYVCVLSEPKRPLDNSYSVAVAVPSLLGVQNLESSTHQGC